MNTYGILFLFWIFITTVAMLTVMVNVDTSANDRYKTASSWILFVAIPTLIVYYGGLFHP